MRKMQVILSVLIFGLFSFISLASYGKDCKAICQDVFQRCAMADCPKEKTSGECLHACVIARIHCDNNCN